MAISSGCLNNPVKKINLKISNSLDDTCGWTIPFVHENYTPATGRVACNYPYLYHIETGGLDFYWSALRFKIDVSKGCKILKSYIRLYVYNPYWNNISVKIHCENTNNSKNFDNNNTYLYFRELTSNYTIWSEDNLSRGWHRSPDISKPLNEVINRDDWKKGNYISIILKPLTGKSCLFYSYDEKPEYAPQLHIEWKEK